MTELLAHPRVEAALVGLPRSLIMAALRQAVADARSHIGSATSMVDADSIVEFALNLAQAGQRQSLRHAINATGVILHTGLGRSVLCSDAQRAVAEVAAGHSTLEIDIETGRRGSRQNHVQDLICELTGAESALVVNNNAAAVCLAVTCLATGCEVIVSRGELVEIGGAFRMPDIIRAGGATLVEVGTTNRTRLSDFERAITERTGLLLRCHPSNFKIVGFVEEVPAAELASLGRERGVPVVDDLGSGAILDLAICGAAPTVTLSQALESGCDLVTASGDKLLGGPQAGIIVGRSEYVGRLAKHPFARAMRVDKLTLAALEATLRLYRDPDRARAEIPSLRYLGRTADSLSVMAEKLRGKIAGAAGDSLNVDTVAEESQVGGGSLPGENLATTCVRIRPAGAQMTPESLARSLRCHMPPVFARIKDSAVLLDPRTLEESEFADICSAVTSAIK